MGLQLSWLEHCVDNAGVVGSSPTRPTKLPMSGSRIPGDQLSWESTCFASRGSSVRSRHPPPLKNDSAERCYNRWLSRCEAKADQKPELQYKSSLKQTAFILRFISIGCSLKIHRVEISVAGGKRKSRFTHRAASNILIASKQIFCECKFIQ